MVELAKLTPVVLIVLGVVALLITIAPLAIWSHTSKTARLLKEQNDLLRRMANGRPVGRPRGDS